jgi:hypothetical protein
VVIRASETDLAVLDLRQERNARALGDGHRIVYGVAGSGKTVLLIARAKLLAEDPEKRILILCYNRLLAQHLVVALTGHRHLTVTTFHRRDCGHPQRDRYHLHDLAIGDRSATESGRRWLASASGSIKATVAPSMQRPHRNVGIGETILLLNVGGA